MRQKKTSKLNKVKKINKKPSMNVMSIDKMQKEFHKMPSKIAAQYRSTIATLKSQQKKLKIELKKAEGIKKSIQVKQKSLTKNKNATLVKKQLVATKKANQLISKTIKDVKVKLEQIQKQTEVAKNKQDTFNSIGKKLKTFKNELKIKKPIQPNKHSSKALELPKQEQPLTAEIQPTVGNMSETGSIIEIT